MEVCQVLKMLLVWWLVSPSSCLAQVRDEMEEGRHLGHAQWKPRPPKREFPPKRKRVSYYHYGGGKNSMSKMSSKKQTSYYKNKQFPRYYRRKKMKSSKGKKMKSSKSMMMMSSKGMNMMSSKSMNMMFKNKSMNVFRPGKRKRPRPPPLSPRTTTIVTDFSSLFSLAPDEGSRVVLVLPRPSDDNLSGQILSLVQQGLDITNLGPGSPCPSANGVEVQVPSRRSSLRIPLVSDTIITLCVDGVVAALQYVVFEDFDDNVGGTDPGDEVRLCLCVSVFDSLIVGWRSHLFFMRFALLWQFPDSFVEVLDVSGDQFTATVFFGPGVGRDIPGTFVLYENATLQEGRRRLVADEFYVFPPNRPSDIGDPCPVPGADFLPPNRVFALTLVALRSPADKAVRGCTNGSIVSVVDFRFVGNSPRTLVSSRSLDICPII